MSVKLLSGHHLEFVSLQGGWTGSSESTLVKMPHCWKSHVAAHICIGCLKNHLNLIKQIHFFCPLLQHYFIIAGLFFEVAETFSEVRGIFRFNSKDEQVSYISLLC